MANIGIDISKEELVEQCMEWRKTYHEQQCQIKLLQKVMGEIANILELPSGSRSYDDVITYLKELKEEHSELHTEHELYADDLEILKMR